MKRTAGLLLLIMLLAMLLPLASCDIIGPKYLTGNTEFLVTIEDTTGFSSVDFEITNVYTITVELLNDEVTKETYKDIQIEYNRDNAVATYTYCSVNRKRIYYSIYFYELGQDDEICVSYKGKTVKINYNVIDYDFEKHGYVTVDSIDDLNKYPEFKEMLLSIKHHEFESPYVGIDEYKLSTYTDAYGEKIKCYSTHVSDNESNPGYANDSYLKYLKDSVYYPSRFYTVPENPISSTDALIGLPLSANTDKGSGRETMSSFSISYSVIDPCCTNPQHPLHSMSFSASQKDKAMTSYFGQYAGEDNTFPSRTSIFFEKYPEQFFVCEINGLTVYILCYEESGAKAYFEDGAYFYSLSSSYEK